MRRGLQFLLVTLVRFYQWTLSPLKTILFGPLGRCRFEPSCSNYTIQAVRRHGPMRGLWLALQRIGRCHPWGPCGHDPVPPAVGSSAPGAPSSGTPSPAPPAVALH